MNPEPDPAELLQEEIARIHSKLENLQDLDLRDALAMKIAHLEQKLAALEKKKEEPEEPEEDSTPPTPQQLRDAEAFVRQARVEKMRGNAVASTDLLRKAVEAAPTAPDVLEALADDLVERRQKKDALPIYKKAVKLAPKNVGLERKYAMLVLGAAGTMSFDDAMRADWNQTPHSSDDAFASPLAAIILTLFLPGVGHIVLGKTSTGITILSIWAACCLWLALMAKDFAHFAAKISGRDGGHVNYVVIVPLLVILMVYVVALSGLKLPKKDAGRPKADRPRPPVDLPFD